MTERDVRRAVRYYLDGVGPWSAEFLHGWLIGVSTALRDRSPEAFYAANRALSTFDQPADVQRELLERGWYFERAPEPATRKA